MSNPEVRTIPVKKASAKALAPYGHILGYNADVEPLPIDFYDGTVKVRRIGEFVSDAQTELPIATLQRRPFEVEWMERHVKHTQAFVSLGSKPFIAVFAPPNDDELPDLEKVEAFMFDGDAGFMMHRGCWHEFPFALFDDTHLMVILRKEATDGLIVDNVIQNEAQGPDLDKKDLVARYNVKLQLGF